MASPLKIGVIDSGLVEHSSFPVAGYRNFTELDGTDQVGHGTAVVSVIMKHCPAAELHIARVFGQKPVCSAAVLAQALDWLLERDVRLINMSFGLRQDRAILAKACLRAMEHECILVAASPARGAEVYPAAYSGVVRATGDARCALGELSVLNTTQADYGGCVRYEGVPVAGASIGCASVTGIIASLLTTEPDQDLTASLHDKARYFGPENRSLNIPHREGRAL